MNDGLDSLGCEDEVGFDAMSLLKGAGGLLSGFGGMFGGDDKGGGGKADAEKQMLQMQAKQAEQSAQTMKMILIAGAAIMGAGLVVLLARK